MDQFNNLNSINDVYGTGVANNASVESDNVIRVKNNSENNFNAKNLFCYNYLFSRTYATVLYRRR